MYLLIFYYHNMVIYKGFPNKKKKKQKKMEKGEGTLNQRKKQL